MNPTSLNEIIARLMGLLTQATKGAIVAPADQVGPDSIRYTGIDSLGMLGFLVAVEDEFGIEWGDDLPSETLHSFDGMARYIGKELGLAT